MQKKKSKVMELGTFERQLRLMALLTQNRLYTMEELSRRIGVGWRTIYRYIELFRDMGFVMEQERGCWRIDKSSSFLRDITDRVHFTDEEAMTLRHILDGVSATHVEARLLRNKLCRIYDFGVVSETAEVDERLAENLKRIYEAMKGRRVAVLHGYKSANSRTVSDRGVEPFQLLQGGGEVRCYEISSGVCKTFKLARVETVEVVDLLWSFEARHETLLTDVFGFSAAVQETVVLRLGALARDLLREEYPLATQYMEDDVLRIPVSSYLGLGRFVMGLPEDVEVVENEGFRAFLREKAKVMAERLGSPPCPPEMGG